MDDERPEALEAVVAPPELSIADAISQLDVAATGGLVLCRPDRLVAGLLTDGDLRRAVLRKVSLADPCGSIATPDPVVARAPIGSAEALQVMLQDDINHLPVVDEAGTLVDFVLRKNLVADVPGDLSAVIMAGGFGKRLLPLTEQVPKPMLPVGERPMLERTIDQLREAGIHDVNLTTHYLPESIVDHFGDGEAFGVRISYSTEDEPLGTAGGLRLIESERTVPGDQRGHPDPGLLPADAPLPPEARRDADGGRPRPRGRGPIRRGGVRRRPRHGPTEKPALTFLVNAGIYLLEPRAWDYLPTGRRFDMTDLIQAPAGRGQVVVSFPIVEYWQDVGPSRGLPARPGGPARWTILTDLGPRPDDVSGAPNRPARRCMRSRGALLPAVPEHHR